MVIFEEPLECRSFLRELARVFAERKVECYAHCLMSNHYHVVIKTLLANLSRTFQQLNSSYAQWWNKRRARVGHVFQGRFGAQVVQDGDYFLNACRYVVRNPVAAGLVASPEQWAWSSYAATAGLVKPPAFLTPQRVVRAFDEVDRRRALRRYRAFVSDAAPGADELPDDPILGDDAFVDSFSDWFVRADQEIPSRQRTTRPPLHTLLSGIVTREDRNARAVEAVRFGYSVVAVARFLDVDRSTIYKIVRRLRQIERPAFEEPAGL
jgi:REP-associated tyrosine transposase